MRVIPRAPIYNAGSRRIRKETKRLLVDGLPKTLDERHREFWTAEWQRMFGHAQFDHLIDFSGYGCFTPFLFSVADARSKSIWLHNDMYADMQRETIGEKHLEERLKAVFTTYRHFDHLVSVSRDLERVNREKLAGYARPEQFTYAANTIDGARVLHMAGLSKAEARAKAHGQDVSPQTGSGPHGAATIDTEQHRLDDVDAARALHGPRDHPGGPQPGPDRTGRLPGHDDVRVGRTALPREEPCSAGQGVREGPRAAPARRG